MAADGAGVAREVFGEEFIGAPGFLNSATYGLPSRRQRESLQTSLMSWEKGELDILQFDTSVVNARVAFAQLAGVPSECVTMGGSVSSLLGLFAAALPDGARVATVTGEFTSVSAPFAAQARRGITVTVLAPQELEERAGEFDVVAVSLIQSADGRLLDTARLQASTRDKNTRVAIDVTQAMGWMKLNVAWADLVVGASYKWLLSPRGAAWMSISPDLAADLIPHFASWYSSETPWSNTYQFPPLLAEDARRFDISPSWFTLLGAGIAMPWLASLDMASVQKHCVQLANHVREAVGQPVADSAILALDIPGATARLEAAGIRAAVRAGRIRVSFHIYNTTDDAEALVDALR
ncbi:aminotransferase class V-fold PLP-dependent enzyme [Rhodococcus sp. ARC_M8]|nr:aminotransferase class V-fold PLP-dependent enzyme [Rhodococcus sp. ARC_M8]